MQILTDFRPNQAKLGVLLGVTQWGQNQEIGKNRKILEKIEKRKLQQISVIKMNILAKFHQERTIFDEIRGH